MNELVKINHDTNNKPTVLGRDLYEFLEIKEPYTMWFDRMKEYGFIEGVDFYVFSEKTEITDSTAFGGIRKTKRVNHQLTLSMSKEISMIQRTEKGKIARQYFIKCEEDLKNIKKQEQYHIPQTYAEALKLAYETQFKNQELEENNIELKTDNMILTKEVEHKVKVIEVLTEDVPVKTMRSILNEVVRKHAARSKISFNEVWRDLYKDFYYQYGINLKVRSENNNLSTLDYAENFGYLKNLYELALSKYEVSSPQKYKDSGNLLDG